MEVKSNNISDLQYSHSSIPSTRLHFNGIINPTGFKHYPMINLIMDRVNPALDRTDNDCPVYVSPDLPNRKVLFR